MNKKTTYISFKINYILKQKRYNKIKIKIIDL